MKIKIIILIIALAFWSGACNTGSSSANGGNTINLSASNPGSPSTDVKLKDGVVALKAVQYDGEFGQEVTTELVGTLLKTGRFVISEKGETLYLVVTTQKESCSAAADSGKVTYMKVEAKNTVVNKISFSALEDAKLSNCDASNITILSEKVSNKLAESIVKQIEGQIAGSAAPKPSPVTSPPANANVNTGK